jgi:hypothetical protein
MRIKSALLGETSTAIAIKYVLIGMNISITLSVITAFAERYLLN